MRGVPGTMPDAVAVGRERQEGVGPPHGEVKGGTFRLYYVVLGVWLALAIAAIAASAGGAFGKFGTTGFYVGVGVSSGGFLIGAILLGVLCVCRRTSSSSNGSNFPSDSGPLPACFQTFVEAMRDVNKSIPSDWGNCGKARRFQKQLKHYWTQATKKKFGERPLGHEHAKTLFKKFSETVFGSKVDFLSPPKLSKEVKEPSMSDTLDPKVFKLRAVSGVENEIQKVWEGKCPGIHYFQVGSECNGSQSCRQSYRMVVPPVGEAMITAETNPFQGSDAQKENPMQLESLNCCLAHGDFNMLHKVVKDSSKLDRNSCIYRGYLQVNDSNIEEVTELVSNHYCEAEFPCFELKNPESTSSSGQKGCKVFLVLQAAPRMDLKANPEGSNLSKDLKEKVNKLERDIAFGNCLAILNQALTCREEFPLAENEEPIIVHFTALGCGRNFDNSPENLAWGMKRAALFLQRELRSARVEVWLDYLKVDDGDLASLKEADDPMVTVGKYLGLS